MFRQQIGKISQPLENVVIEEIERDNGIREVYFTIAMKSLPATAPIAKGVADYASVEPRIGELYVGKSDDRESFIIPFDTYIAGVSALEPKIQTFFTIAKNKGKESSLYYILTTDDIVEVYTRTRLYSISGIRIKPNLKGREEAVMGYLLASKDVGLIEDAKQKLIELSSPNEQRGTLTESEYGFISDILGAIHWAHSRS